MKVEVGEIVTRPTGCLGLSVDDPALDSAEEARFLRDLKSVSEKPGQALAVSSRQDDVQSTYLWVR